MNPERTNKSGLSAPAVDALTRMRNYCSHNANKIRKFRRRNSYFRAEISKVVTSLIPSNSTVLDVGCGSGELLVSTRPRRGIGLDIDPRAWSVVVASDTAISFVAESLEEWQPPNEPFEYVVASGLLEHVYDVDLAITRLAASCDSDSRVVIVTYSRLWQPLLRLAERLSLKTNFPIQNWIPVSELANIARQNGLELVTTRPAVLVPVRIPGSRLLNRWFSSLPLIRHLDFAHVSVFRPAPQTRSVNKVSVVVPARNEAGNIQQILARLPKLASSQEVIFVEGNSTDDTWLEIQRVCDQLGASYHSDLLALQQSGRGKGDAVRAGFSRAQGDMLLILDADISVPPEELPKFVHALKSGTAEFANGSRLVYTMEPGAMRFLNLLGNRFFGSLFTFLLGQQVRDTLCGTKVLWKRDYERIAERRGRFGELDPFGDFDLLFGATALSLRIADVPVHYQARIYGDTNISRFRHGWLLLRMSWLAARRLRFI